MTAADRDGGAAVVWGLSLLRMIVGLRKLIRDRLCGP